MNEGRGERAREREIIRRRTQRITEDSIREEQHEEAHVLAPVYHTEQLELIARAICNLAETLDADRSEQL